MKKNWIIAGACLALPLAAGLAWLNNPSKRFSKHMNKARIYVRQDNYPAARAEYEAAYALKGGYTPWASEEVLKFESSHSLHEKRVPEAVEYFRNYLRANPDSARTGLLLAKVAFEHGDFRTAFEVLDDMLRRDPGSMDARAALAQIREAQGRLDLAEQQYRAMVRAHPTSARAILLLSDNLAKQARTAEARELLRLILERNPKNQDAQLKLVDTWLIDRRSDSAEAVLAGWRRADSSMAADIALRSERIYAMNGQWDQASRALAPYLDKSREHTNAYLDQAILLAKQGKYDEAVKVYEDIGQVNPDVKVLTLVLEGLLQLAAQNPAQALESIRSADPSMETPENLRYSLYAYLAMGQDGKAKEMLADPKLDAATRVALDKVLRGAVANKDYMAGLGLMHYYLITGQKSSVLAATEALYRKYPRNDLVAGLFADQLQAIRRYDLAYRVLAGVSRPTPEQRITMAQVLFASGKGGQAEALLRGVQAEDPKIRGVNVLLGDYALRQGRTDDAMRLYARELEVDPDNLVALNNLAWYHGIRRQDLDSALPYLSRIEKASPFDPRLLDTVGWSYALGGRWDKADLYLAQALELVPDDPSFLYHMSRVKAQLGSKDQARQYLRRALDSKYSWDERAEAERLYQTLG